MRVRLRIQDFVRTSGGQGSALALALIAFVVIGFGVGSLVVLHRQKAEYIPGMPVHGVTDTQIRHIPRGYQPVRFDDVTARAGIHFVHFSGHRSAQLPEDYGSGAAWGDYNQDGWPDLFLANEAGPLTMTPQELLDSPARCALYRNNGDGTFTDVTDAAGLGNLRGWYMGAAWGDYDNSGYPSLFLTSYGTNRLFHNNGNGTFTEVTDRAGVGNLKGFWTGASWGDYDRDGRLDLYVCGYVKYHPPTPQERATISHRDGDNEPFTLNPISYPPERNLLYHNNGDGTFTEVAGRLGVADPQGKSLSATWCDIDGDGWPDLYVNNDVSMHAFYQNLGHGHFKDISTESLACDYRGGMGIAAGDWNNDTTMDLFLGHWLAQEKALYTNMEPAQPFRNTKPHRIRMADLSNVMGLGQTTLDYVCWGTAFLDIDDDGRPDLAMANGSTLEERSDPTRLVPEKNQLFWNSGPALGFYEVEDLAGNALKTPNNARGLAVSDWLRNGHVGMVITRNGGPAMLLRNMCDNGNGWIDLWLTGTKSNRDALGASVKVRVGRRWQLQEVGAGSSYLSQNDTVLTFGLGHHHVVDTLEVRWPSGLIQRFRHVRGERFLRLIEGGVPHPVALQPGVHGP